MSHGLRLGLMGLLLGASLMPLSAARAQDRVQVPSHDVSAGQAVVMPGFWFAAKVAGSAPAMVLMHGCGGPYNKGVLAERYTTLAARLNALGVHVLVTDSLTPRGEKELCTQRNGARRVTQTQRRRDALGALQWLAGQPGVDASRLGLLGWSNGGSTVLAASNARHAEVAAAQVKPSLLVAFYPGCANELARGFEAIAPLLMLVGQLDDWTPAAPCEQLAQVNSASGASGASRIQLLVYEGAYHGFDGTAPVRLRRDVPNGVNPGRGVHVGAEPTARAASALALQEFLRREWNLP